MPDRIGALSLALVLLAAPIAAGAQAIPAGALEWTFAMGGGASLDLPTRSHGGTVTSVHVLPHMGYVLTGEVGERPGRGNPELIAEPMLIHLDASDSGTVAGLAVLPRWVFALTPRVRPYLEAGAGILGGQLDLRQTNCDVNFVSRRRGRGDGLRVRAGGPDTWCAISSCLEHGPLQPE